MSRCANDEAKLRRGTNLRREFATKRRRWVAGGWKDEEGSAMAGEIDGFNFFFFFFTTLRRERWSWNFNGLPATTFFSDSSPRIRISRDHARLLQDRVAMHAIRTYGYVRRFLFVRNALCPRDTFYPRKKSFLPLLRKFCAPFSRRSQTRRVWLWKIGEHWQWD